MSDVAQILAKNVAIPLAETTALQKSAWKLRCQQLGEAPTLHSMNVTDGLFTKPLPTVENVNDQNM